MSVYVLDSSVLRYFPINAHNFLQEKEDLQYEISP